MLADLCHSPISAHRLGESQQICWQIYPISAGRFGKSVNLLADSPPFLLAVLVTISKSAGRFTPPLLPVDLVAVSKSAGRITQKTFYPWGYLSCWSCIEKTSVKQDLKCKVCSNFQMSFLHLSQMDPLVEASSGQEQYCIRSAWHLVSLWVRLTFSQMFPIEASSAQEWYSVGSSWPELRYTPWYRYLVAKSSTTSGTGIWWPRVVQIEVQLS